MLDVRPVHQAPPMPLDPCLWYTGIRDMKVGVADLVQAGWSVPQIRAEVHERIGHAMPAELRPLLDRAVNEQICLTTHDLEAERLTDA